MYPLVKSKVYVVFDDVTGLDSHVHVCAPLAPPWTPFTVQLVTYVPLPPDTVPVTTELPEFTITNVLNLRSTTIFRPNPGSITVFPEASVTLRLKKYAPVASFATVAASNIQGVTKFVDGLFPEPQSHAGAGALPL